MCGIAGSFNFSNEELIKSMLKSTQHRGPDDTDYFINNECMLGINRLAILDIELGKQPMQSSKGDLRLVFNGEIFNYLELKKDLEKKGFLFKTKNSDTEIILVAYQAYGIDFVKHLNGMFSIALYDSNKKKLIICRDRSGIKPLFFTTINNHFFFSSEIKSFFNISFLKKEPDISSLLKYFSLKNIPAPKTAYKNIQQLLPGQIFEISQGGIKKNEFWNISKNNHKMDEKEYVELIYKNLEKSVKMQLRSDVDLACFLSGGLDSSAVTAIASKHYSKKLKTFSVVYDEKIRRKNQDNKYSKMIAEKFDTDHYELFLDEKKIFNNIEKALSAFDQPFSGAITTYFLSEMVSKYVKVALTGDGADELFGSYSFPRIIEPIELLKKNGIEFKNFIKNTKEYSKKTLFLKAMSKKTIEEIKISLFSINSEEKEKLLNKNYYKQEDNLINYFKNININYNSNSDDMINSALSIDFKSLLPDQVLSFVDILSMQHSLEIRPPFLDNELIDIAFKIPGNLKIKHSNPKVILKKALRPLLPDEIIDRPKEGFVMPIEEMFIKEKKDYISNVLSKRNIKKHDLFNYDYLKILIDNIMTNSFRKNNIIWTLFSFQLWWNKNFN